MSPASHGNRHDPAAPIAYRSATVLLPGLLRLTQENRSMFSGAGTNTYLIGESEVLVLDPGERRDDGHLERIVEAVSGRPVLGVLPSHGHPDHWPLAEPLARRLGAPLLFQNDEAPFHVDRVVSDGDVLRGEELELVVLHTPGHAPDHLCLHWPGRSALFSGDHVMGWSTSIIAPPGGHLPRYLESLRRLQGLELEHVFPAHGEAILTPRTRMEELYAHREQRTRQALAALADGEATIAELVERIYTDTPRQLHPAAHRWLWAYLLALEEEGRIERRPAPAVGEESREFDGEGGGAGFEDAARAVWRLIAPAG
ncbi:MAG: MBL fold metallo-hydrolase [Acidobacteria bacterium]|nr:MAG: MBL fold metallo-hydrolase [Acidobacteriota bacterium]